MADQPLDLKRLLQLINDQKNLNANLVLDEGCQIETNDQATLVKIINYFINFLHQLSSKPMEIGLDLMGNSILMTMMTFTEIQEIPELSPNLVDALKSYNATYETVHNAGNYIQIKITFSK